MPTHEARSFLPVNDDELPADVRDFTRLFRSDPVEPETDPKRAPPEPPRPPLA